jgi:hypothetical protein
MTIEDVKATIRQGNQALKEARTTIEQANAHLPPGNRAIPEPSKIFGEVRHA